MEEWSIELFPFRHHWGPKSILTISQNCTACRAFASQTASECTVCFVPEMKSGKLVHAGQTPTECNDLGRSIAGRSWLAPGFQRQNPSTNSHSKPRFSGTPSSKLGRNSLCRCLGHFISPRICLPKLPL